MDTHAQEVDLVNRAVAGDSQALEAVLRLWGPRVRRFASRLCPATEVLDAVQETLLVLIDRIGTLRAAEALTSWSFQVVKRHCRKIGSLWLRDIAIARELGVLEEESAFPDAHRLLLMEELGRSLLLLSAKDRQIITLRDLEELSIQQTADRLGLEPAAVKSRLHRARVALRKRMTAMFPSGT